MFYWCLPRECQALDRVNAEAMKRPACGIAFLGDFWHVRGSIKVKISSILESEKESVDSDLERLLAFSLTWDRGPLKKFLIRAIAIVHGPHCL